MALKDLLMPRDMRFFGMLNAQARTVKEGADRFVEMLSDYRDPERAKKELKDIEHRGDVLTHDLYQAMNQTFITPIDREDLAALASALDDVLDFTYATANHLALYHIREVPPGLLEVAKMLQGQTEHLVGAVEKLRELRNPEVIRIHLVEIHRLENLADDATNAAIADLFEDDDVKRILKLRDIYQYLETATDKCEDAADAIRDVVVKYA
ncbi:MAG: DUF47 domain-containing protein [Methanobacteriota archaeon]